MGNIEAPSSFNSLTFEGGGVAGISTVANFRGFLKLEARFRTEDDFPRRREKNFVLSRKREGSARLMKDLLRLLTAFGVLQGVSSSKYSSALHILNAKHKALSLLNVDGSTKHDTLITCLAGLDDY